MSIKGLLKNRFFLIGAVVVLVAAISTGVFIMVQKSHEDVAVDAGKSGDEPVDKISLSAGDITLEPMVYDSAGVDPDSGFKINVNRKIDAKQLESVLSVKPSRGFAIKSVAENQFELDFAEPLEADSIYQFALNEKENTPDFSWAFQTKKEFKVLRTLPRNEGTGVPVNSGIEITFSYEGMEKLDNYFEISPKVNGRFEYHKKVAVFVPEGLEYGTVYTVKIKKGLGLQGSTEKTTEDTVFQFQTQLKDNTNNEHYFNFAEVMYNFTTNETPTLMVYGDEYYQSNQFNVEVYSYRDAESFIKDLDKYDETPKWAQRSSRDNVFDKSKLEKFTSFKTKILYTDSPWYQQMLQFPDKLPEGYYFVSVTLNGHEYYAHIQVNDLSVYLMNENEKSLVWVNNSKTGEPVQNVDVQVNGVSKAVTDAQGITQLEGLKKNSAGTDSGSCFLLVPQKGAAFVARLFSNSSYSGYGYYNGYGYNAGSGTTAQQYWSYLYLDRGMYLTDDTIRLWGLVKPRITGEKVGKVTVELMKYSYDTYSERQSVLVSKELELTLYGTYSGELSYKNFNPGSYYVLVKSGDKTFEQTYIEVSDYTKPAYKLDVSQDKEVCFIGDTVKFDVQASFFEGSPVSGLELNYNAYNSSDWTKNKDGRLTCGSDGKATYIYIPEASSKSAGMDWRPVYSNITFDNAKAEEEDVQAYASMLVFPRDIMIDAKGKLTDNIIDISVKTNKIDISKLKRSDEIYDYVSGEYKYRGAPVDTSFKVKVIEKHWEKEKIGQYYDFINKVSRDKYRYYEVTNTIDEFELSTVNGTAARQISKVGISDYSSYYMEIMGADSLNRPIKFTEYIYSSNLYGDYLERMEMSKYYSLAEENRKTMFKAGEKASLKVTENEKDYTVPQNGRVLFMTMKNGLIDYSVKDTNRYERTFEEGLIPNAFVKAVYFDGTNTYNAGSFGLFYDYSEKTLDITLKPDKDQYKPGDTVNVDVSVKDKAGNSCAAEVNLSVVDEAFFALRGQSVDTAAGIYSYVFDTGVTSEYVSYSPISARYPYAECGEGGDSGRVRSDFKDNAFFGNVTTDNSGKGRISFKLPDNLTSWRLTGQGLTEDLKAGNTKININAKLPFFTTLIFNDIYLTGDKPGISLRSYGMEVTDNGIVKYDVAVEGANGYKKAFNSEKKANEFCNMGLESLGAGDYTITVSAMYGSFKDAVKKSFKVVDSILETARTEYFDISDNLNIASGLDISADNSLVELSFYNKNLSRYNRVLNSLYYSWGQRVDQVLARKLAAEHLKKYFGREDVEQDDVKLADYQTSDGGIALLTYDSPNPELSAKISALGCDYFNKSDLEGYFTSVIENRDSPNEEIAAAYFGLASLGRPVLIDVRAFLEENNISLKEKLYLGMALVELGDYSGARTVYDGILKDYGKSAEKYEYIDQGKGSDDIVEVTTLYSLMALKLKTADRDALFDYITSKSTDELLVNLEKLIYLQNTVPEAEKTGSLGMSTGGGVEEVKLTGTERKTMTVTYDALKKMKFSNVNGEIECAAKFIGPLDAVQAGSGSMVGISRVYKVNGVETTSFKHSDVVQVELKINFGDAAPEGYYQITDVLPSGLRFIPYGNWNWEQWYWGQTNGQKIMFGYNFSLKFKKSDVIRYYARVVSPGTYTADDAVLKHVKSQVYSFSGRKSVNIGEN